MHQKDEEIKVRVTKQTKERVLALARDRGESESVIVREALKAYLDKAPVSSIPPPMTTADSVVGSLPPPGTKGGGAKRDASPKGRGTRLGRSAGAGHRPT